MKEHVSELQWFLIKECLDLTTCVLLDFHARDQAEQPSIVHGIGAALLGLRMVAWQGLPGMIVGCAAPRAVSYAGKETPIYIWVNPPSRS